jgi:mono/diheme cytochrome c family protein
MVLSLLVLVLAGAYVPAALAQENTFQRTTLDGVFTAAQAERGSEAFAANCSSCHAKDLSGQAGPPLKGESFMDNWREDSVQTLFGYISTRMPQRAAGKLSQQTYLDIVAHILSTNLLPAGSTELTAESLRDIRLVGKDGPQPIPKFSLISLVGCLVKGEAEWKLQRASEPVRAHDEKPRVQDMEASVSKPLGKDEYRLVYIDDLRPTFNPEKHAGEKLHAQGYLLVNEKGIGLSVTWLEAVGSSCNN